MSNNKQSSLEYLMDKLFDPSSMVKEQLEWFEQAKAMHKEEIMTAFRIGDKFSVDYYLESELDTDEQYYNETFKNQSTN
jgi:hypothetical protein